MGAKVGKVGEMGRTFGRPEDREGSGGRVGAAGRE